MTFHFKSPSVSVGYQIPILDPTAVHIWQLHWIHHQADWYTAIRCLSPAEVEQMHRFVRPQDRLRFGICRGALRHLLSRYTQISPQDLIFAEQAYGKPYLQGPAGSIPPQFNVSHSGEWALYAVAATTPVGVDIEQVRPLSQLAALIQRCLSPKELAAVNIMTEEETHQRFFEFWTCKEAYLKATGEGLSFPMNQVEVQWTPTPALTLLRAQKSQPQWSLYPWQPTPGYVAALVIQTTSNGLPSPTSSAIQAPSPLHLSLPLARWLSVL